ncbi:MAG: AIR synthase family protein [Lachnospiraceae bacterium]|nr:AIR synthase family protein [Lachnospiraceae bacterium]
MKIGKVSENVLKRSVLKEIKTNREEIIIGAGVGEDCAVLALKEDEVFVTSTDPITGATKDIGRLAVHVTANDLASSGAEPVGMLISALLPQEVTEEELKEMMHQVCEEAAGLNIQIMGGHTEITDAVIRPVLTVTGVGKAKKDAYIITGAAKPGQDIVVSKWIGLEGSSILAKEKKEELLSRYPLGFINEAAGFDRYLSVVPEAAVAVKTGVSAMHDVTEGGIFGALWEMAESSGVGLEVELMKIPIRQETVEICNFFDINPYGLISSGAMLMVSDNGHELVAALEKAGIHASLIGKTTNSCDRVVINKEEKRFLEPPKSDELYKII